MQFSNFDFWLLKYQAMPFPLSPRSNFDKWRNEKQHPRKKHNRSRQQSKQHPPPLLRMCYRTLSRRTILCLLAMGSVRLVNRRNVPRSKEWRGCVVTITSSKSRSIASWTPWAEEIWRNRAPRWRWCTTTPFIIVIVIVISFGSGHLLLFVLFFVQVPETPYCY